MKQIELFYPQLLCQIGSYTFTDGIAITASSSKKSYFDWAKLQFTKEFQNKITLQTGEAANIQLGYDGIFSTVFEGYVMKGYNSATGQNEILLKDSMLLLEKLQITNTFLDVTPREIIEFGLNQAGITDYSISTEIYPTSSQVVIAGKSFIDVLNLINTIWGISVSFYFSAGTFYWGTKPEQEKVYQFEHGNNIISLQRSNGEWLLETVLMPYIKHSHIINVTHPAVTGDYEVQRIMYQTNAAGFLRTIIAF